MIIHCMKLSIITFCLVLFGFQSAIGQSYADIVTGRMFDIHSEILNEDRTCLLSLPESYNDPINIEKKYPVLILLDGASHFETASGIVRMMSSDRDRNSIMPETIIVAIENVDRERDFTVTKLKTKRPNRMGGGKNFLNFIEKELIPFIDQNYRTEPIRTLVGHSLGGLLTLNAYMDENNVFDDYISMDPSIWWDEETMQNKVDAIGPVSLKKKLYIATANQGEANYERNKKRHDLLFAMLKNKSDEQLNVKVAYFDEEDHRSVPFVALYEGLKYINQENEEGYTID